jgi:hypothetical protein
MRKSMAYQLGEAYATFARSESAAKVERLIEFVEQLPIWRWDYFWFHDNAYTPAELLFFVLEPDQDGDREAAAAFFDRVCANAGDMTDANFVKEFAEGMLAFQPV